MNKDNCMHHRRVGGCRQSHNFPIHPMSETLDTSEVIQGAEVEMTVLNTEGVDARIEAIQSMKLQLEELGVLDETEERRAESAIHEVRAAKPINETYLEEQLRRKLEEAQSTLDRQVA